MLPPWNSLIVALEYYKECSDALQAGKTDLIQAAMNYAHEEYRPDGIVDAKTLLDLVTTPQPPSDYDYPYKGLQSKLHGIKLGELTTVTAGSRPGKSAVCSDLTAELLYRGMTVG